MHKTISSGSRYNFYVDVKFYWKIVPRCRWFYFVQLLDKIKLRKFNTWFIFFRCGTPIASTWWKDIHDTIHTVYLPLVGAAVSVSKVYERRLHYLALKFTVKTRHFAQFFTHQSNQTESLREKLQHRSNLNLLWISRFPSAYEKTDVNWDFASTDWAADVFVWLYMTPGGWPGARMCVRAWCVRKDTDRRAWGEHPGVRGCLSSTGFGRDLCPVSNLSS